MKTGKQKIHEAGITLGEVKGTLEAYGEILEIISMLPSLSAEENKKAVSLLITVCEAVLENDEARGILDGDGLKNYEAFLKRDEEEKRNNFSEHEINHDFETARVFLHLETLEAKGATLGKYLREFAEVYNRRGTSMEIFRACKKAGITAPEMPTSGTDTIN